MVLAMVGGYSFCAALVMRVNRAAFPRSPRAGWSRRGLHYALGMLLASGGILITVLVILAIIALLLFIIRR